MININGYTDIQHEKSSVVSGKGAPDSPGDKKVGDYIQAWTGVLVHVEEAHAATRALSDVCKALLHPIPCGLGWDDARYL